MSRVFVTGGSGFVGRNLIAVLTARGDEVIALARSPKATLTVEELGALSAHGDLDDTEALKVGMLGCDTVIHAAALAAEWGDPDDFYRFNVTGTENALAAARAVGVKTFVHISTEAVLANGSPIINADESRPIPDNALPLYPRTKGEAETAALAANGEDFRVVVVRPRMIWGKDDSTLLPAFVEAVNDGRFMWMDGGHYKTSTCHVDNVIEGVLLAAEKGQGGEVYFLTDGDPVEFREFITAVLATQDVTPADKSIPTWLAWRAAQTCEGIWNLLGLKSLPPITRFTVNIIGQEVTVNDSKARRELGYTGRVTREEGLAGIKRVVV